MLLQQKIKKGLTKGTNKRRKQDRVSKGCIVNDKRRIKNKTH
jgi:hypothetical protein